MFDPSTYGDSPPPPPPPLGPHPDAPARPVVGASAKSAPIIRPAKPSASNPWKHVAESFEEAVTYIEGRRDGTIKSLKTPWATFNDVGMNGIEWHTMVVIGARPAVGKTLVAQLITSQAPALNPDQDFMVLNFQFEMLARNTAMREMSSRLNRSIKYLNSADNAAGKISTHDLAAAKAYAAAQKTRKEYVVEQAMNVSRMRKTIHDFYHTFRKPFLIVLDHATLVQRDASEKDKQETLQSLGAMLTEIKRELPVIILILTQLNRTIDDAGRQDKAGTHGNYPNEADVFGGDGLLMHTDIMCLMNRPSKYNLEIYGPERFLVHKNLLAFHFLKVRTGNPRISFYEAEFEKMNIREIPPPARKPVAKSTF